LSADGVASFEVVPTLPAVSTKGKAIPLCVRSPPGNASSPWVLSVPIGFGPFGDGGATADAQGEGDAPGDTSDATGESGDSQGDVGDAPGDAPGGGQ
jgi:hypothetical protein